MFLLHRKVSNLLVWQSKTDTSALNAMETMGTWDGYLSNELLSVILIDTQAIWIVLHVIIILLRSLMVLT